MLCQSSFLRIVICFVYKDKWWFDESMPVIFCMENTSVEAWQNEKHYLKENNTSENPIQRREIFKSVDHKKHVRSGHNFCCWCSFLVELSRCRVTYENFNKSLFFFNLV